MAIPLLDSLSCQMEELRIARMETACYHSPLSSWAESAFVAICIGT